MNKKLQFLVLFFALLLTAAQVEAQTIAYVQSENIVQAMPEYKSAMANAEAYGKQLQKQLQEQEQNLMKYYQDVMQKAQNGQLSPAQQKEAEQKLAKMQQELQVAVADAEKRLAEKEQSLLKPIYDKFDTALKAVAKSNGYNYILDKKLLLYSTGGIDATDKVKSQLGI